MRTLAAFVILSAAFAAAQSQQLPADIDPQSYSRLPLIQRSQLLGEDLKIYDEVAGKDAQGNPRPTAPLGPQATSLYSMGVARPMNDLNRYIRTIAAGTAMYHLCALIGARAFDEPYEWAAHETGARRTGIDERTIEAVRTSGPLDGLPPKEALVVRYGRALFYDRKVPSDLYAEVVKEFGQQGMLDLAATMADYAFAAVMLRAVDQHVPNTTVNLPPIKH